MPQSLQCHWSTNFWATSLKGKCPISSFLVGYNLPVQELLEEKMQNRQNCKKVKCIFKNPWFKWFIFLCIYVIKAPKLGNSTITILVIQCFKHCINLKKYKMPLNPLVIMTVAGVIHMLICNVHSPIYGISAYHGFPRWVYKKSPHVEEEKTWEKQVSCQQEYLKTSIWGRERS